MSACRPGRTEQQQREAERKGLLAQVQQAKKELNEVRHPGPQLCPTAAARWPWSHDAPPFFALDGGGGWQYRALSEGRINALTDQLQAAKDKEDADAKKVRHGCLLLLHLHACSSSNV